MTALGQGYQVLNCALWNKHRAAHTLFWSCGIFLQPWVYSKLQTGTPLMTAQRRDTHPAVDTWVFEAITYACVVFRRLLAAETLVYLSVFKVIGMRMLWLFFHLYTDLQNVQRLVILLCVWDLRLWRLCRFVFLALAPVLFSSDLLFRCWLFSSDPLNGWRNLGRGHIVVLKYINKRK